MSNIVVVVDEVTRFVKIIEGGPQGPAGPGVPTGGATGHVLAKSSADDYDTEWTGSPFLSRVSFDTDPAGGSLLAGEVEWNPAERTLDLGVNSGSRIPLGQALHYPLCRNTFGFTIQKGQAVMVNPVSIVTGDHFNIVRAVADGTYPAKLILGVAHESIPVGELGIITWFGRVDGVTLSNIQPIGESWDSGDILYADPNTPGYFTNVEPTPPDLVVPLAVVLQITGGNCKLIVRGVSP